MVTEEGVEKAGENSRSQSFDGEYNMRTEEEEEEESNVPAKYEERRSVYDCSV